MNAEDNPGEVYKGCDRPAIDNSRKDDGIVWTRLSIDWELALKRHRKKAKVLIYDHYG